MGIEIERKFLVIGDEFMLGARKIDIKQGFLTTGSGPSVRVRVAGSSGFITIKGPSNGIRREEFEYPIPPGEAEQMIRELCPHPPLSKTRYVKEHEGHTWEVDVFHGKNAGLIVAEVEIAEENARITLPVWVGEEVTQDARYYNAYLATHPYSEW